MGPIRTRLCSALVLAALLAGGCHSLRPGKEIVPAPVPRELEKVCLPDYRVEPPDILVIEAIKAVPKPPYRIEPLDVLFIQATPSVPDEPLAGLFNVDPDGTINLGTTYGGSFRVAGMTLIEVKAMLEKHWTTVVKLLKPQATVTLAQSRATQRITGPHLIRPDGSISLGTYGSVRVSGMTLAEVRHAVEAQLAEYLLDPEVSVDVQNYNSKLYYMILDGGGLGQQVYRLPITGNETVLDAISQVNGLSPVSSKHRIWVARPTHAGPCEQQVMTVNWKAISQCGDPTTNYQLYPGDRVYVQSDALIDLDHFLAKLISPIERVFGVSLLGQQTILSFDRSQRTGAGAG